MGTNVKHNFAILNIHVATKNNSSILEVNFFFFCALMKPIENSVNSSTSKPISWQTASAEALAKWWAI